LVNLLHVCEILTHRWHDATEIQVWVPLETLFKFAERNNFDVYRKFSRGRYRVKLERRIIPVCVISDEKTPDFKFMDISDIHIGHPNFDEKLLREKLQYAIDNDIKLIFIAGDVFEGIQSEHAPSYYCEQLSQAFNIFKDYPLTYHAINGNHDYTFEQVGLPNPIQTLSARLKAEGIDFNFHDVYLMDFVIGGVIKRVMHVERQSYNLKRIFTIIKLRQFEYDGWLVNTVGGRLLPVRFFLAGHIHANVQIYYAKKKIFISQPGSFIHDYGGIDEDCVNVFTGRVIDQKIFLT